MTIEQLMENDLATSMVIKAIEKDFWCDPPLSARDREVVAKTIDFLFAKIRDGGIILS